MSATKACCLKQVKRLAVAPLFRPTTEQAAKDWLDTLMRHCQSDDHAEAVMTEFLSTATDSQNPLADMAAIARRTEKHDIAPPGCWRCEIGPDVETGEMRWAHHVPTEVRGYTCAGRCQCARGEWLAAKDKERKREAGRESGIRTTSMTAASDVKTLAGGRE